MEKSIWLFSNYESEAGKQMSVSKTVNSVNSMVFMVTFWTGRIIVEETGVVEFLGAHDGVASSNEAK